MEEPVLTVSDLSVSFLTATGVQQAVDGLSFTVPAGETLGIVGESGCGKTTAALSVMGLVPVPPGEVSAKELKLLGRELQGLNAGEMSRLRGRQMSMIFQDTMSSLNPLLPVGEQVAEHIRFHLGLTRREARQRSAEMLDMVRIPAPSATLQMYPHQLSGGMCQRVLLAIALACGPALLLADEPTTALDVTTQAQILRLLGSLQQEQGMALILITHDLSVIAGIARRVLVMYAGAVMEEADVAHILAEPLHPYTNELVAPLHSFTGASRLPTTFKAAQAGAKGGCRYFHRCRSAADRCREFEPPLLQCGSAKVRCWLAAKGG